MGNDVILAAGSRSVSHNTVLMAIKELCVQLSVTLRASFFRSPGWVAAVLQRVADHEFVFRSTLSAVTVCDPRGRRLFFLASTLCKYSVMLMVCGSLCLSCHPVFWTLVPVHFNPLSCVFCSAAPPHPARLSYFRLNMFGFFQASFMKSWRDP